MILSGIGWFEFTIFVIAIIVIVYSELSGD